MAAQAGSMSSALGIPRSTSSQSHYCLFHKPMRVNMRAATAYRDSVDSDIEAHLKQMVTIRPPLEVFQPMHHLVFSTPKSIAPVLCVASCEVVGGDRSDALSAAAALHLMHVAAAIHENLLVGAARRQYPFGPNIELLTGDGVVPLGFELLAGHNRSKSSEDQSGRLVRVVVEITRAVGSQGVVEGQYRKYVSQENDSLCHAKQLKAKRSEFSACGAACGAILGGGSEGKIQKLRQCGLYVGMMNETLLEDGEEVWKRQKVMELRSLALKELEGFDDFISSLVDSLCCYDTQSPHTVGNRKRTVKSTK